jgi:uncharacterized damage-inducible protein DinB
MLEVFGHNTWANLRLIDVCAGLTDQQLDKAAEGTYGSIRDTLVHTIGAEQGYLFRLTGERPDPSIKSGEWPGFPLLRERAEQNGERFAGVISGDDPGRVIGWTTQDGEDAAMPVALFLVQVINHGNEHRSQVCTVITTLGIEPPELSGWLYAIQSGALTGVSE